MIYWALLLHMYQPPTQSHLVLHRICQESYRPLLDVLVRNQNARISLNINGVLTEMLWDHGLGDVMERVNHLASQGRLDLVGSGKYHPIFPLIPEEERLRQIELNVTTNQQFFGEFYRPSGFFLPELAYSPDVAETLLEAGCRWMLLSGVACPGPWPLDVVQYVERGGRRLKVLFRDDLLSNKISFRHTDPSAFLNDLRLFSTNHQDIYVVTAMDGETFGHHHKLWERDFLEAVFRLLAAGGHGIAPATLSEVVDIFGKGQAVEPYASSWSASRGDLEGANPHPLWNSPNNDLHRLLWRHLHLCMAITGRALEVATTPGPERFAQTARHFLDQSMHSCQFWWASGRPMWDVDMVHRGLMLQQQVMLDASRAIQGSQMPPQEKEEWRSQWLEARTVRREVEDMLFSW